MAGFTKFDPRAFLDRDRQGEEKTLAGLATLAGGTDQFPRPPDHGDVSIPPPPYLQEPGGTSAKAAKAAKVPHSERVGEATAAPPAPAPSEEQAHPWYSPEAERAALAKDAGLAVAELDRDWPAVAWRRLHAARLVFYTLPRYGSDGGVARYDRPENLAYSHVLNRWRVKHWEKPPPGICAGCNGPLGSGPALDLVGYAVHEGRDPDCLAAHSRQWRTEGMAGLAGFGIKPPPGWEP